MEIDVSFAKIVINGKTYFKDIILCSDGKVLKRLKDLSKPLRDIYKHTPLSKKELEETIKIIGKVDLLIIGNGLEGKMPIQEEALEYLNEIGLKYTVKKTKEACEIFNELLNKGVKVVAALHLTC